jgi:hypothetical protein
LWLPLARREQRETAMETLKYYGAPILLVVVILLAFILLIFLSQSPPTGGVLSLLAIGGVIVLILMLTAVAMIFSGLGLTDKTQAMGLPDGSIRSVIALSLIVLFAILSVFLYQGVSTGGHVNTIENLSDTDKSQFVKDHASALDLQAVLAKDAAGQPLKNADGTPKNLYTVTYRSANPTGDDFAKQLLVLLGTLMTAITSFYLGAGTATSAAAPGKTAAHPPPTLSGIKPTVHTIATDGPVIKQLQVMGSNLNVITRVKIVRAGVQIAGTNVASNPTSVTCDIAVSATTTPDGPPWDVVVDDGGSISANLPDALTITAAAVAAVQAAANPPPTVSGIKPTVHTIATDGSVIKLQVTGSNLNVITRVKIVRAGVQIAGTNVVSSPTGVTCDIAVSTATTPPGPPWDVVVDDGGSISASLLGALTIV